MKIVTIGPVTRLLHGRNAGGVAQYNTNLILSSRSILYITTGRFYSLFKSHSQKVDVSFSAVKFLFVLAYIINMVRFLFIGYKPRYIVKSVIIYIKLIFANFEDATRVILHFQGVDNIPINVQGNLASKLKLVHGCDFHIILTVHSYHILLNGQKYRYIFNNGFANAGRIIHVSNVDYVKGRDNGFYFSKDIVHNFHRFDKPISEVDFAKKNNKVLFVGSDIPRKRYSLFEWLAAKRPNYEFVSIGTKHKNTGSVVTLGICSRERVLTEMKDSQILINPSLSESFGLVYLEALSQGCKVIGYDEVLKEYLELIPNLVHWLSPFSPNGTHDRLMFNFDTIIDTEISYQNYLAMYRDLQKQFNVETHLKMLYQVN